MAVNPVFSLSDGWYFQIPNDEPHGPFDSEEMAWGKMAQGNRVAELPQWKPISEAPTDGSVQLVYTSPYHDLPGFISSCAYHPDAGWCTDELREVTAYLPGASEFLRPSFVTPKAKMSDEEFVRHQ